MCFFDYLPKLSADEAEEELLMSVLEEASRMRSVTETNTRRRRRQRQRLPIADNDGFAESDSPPDPENHPAPANSPEPVPLPVSDADDAHRNLVANWVHNNNTGTVAPLDSDINPPGDPNDDLASSGVPTNPEVSANPGVSANLGASANPRAPTQANNGTQTTAGAHHTTPAILLGVGSQFDSQPMITDDMMAELDTMLIEESENQDHQQYDTQPQ